MTKRNIEHSIFNTALLRELRKVAKNSKIRHKHITELSFSNINPSDGEAVFYLPDVGVFACVQIPPNKARSQPDN